VTGTALTPIDVLNDLSVPGPEGLIAESAPTAGLQQTSTLSVGKDWNAYRLAAPRAAQKKR